MGAADGPLLHADGADGSWAWCGVRVRAATDLTAARQFASLGEHERHTKALTSQQSWLHSLLAYPEASVEMRWISDGSSPFVDLVLVARTRAATRDEASAMAGHLRRRLLNAPEQVLTEPIDADDVRWALDPFPVAAGGAAEIRKATATAVPMRADAYTDAMYAVVPLYSAPIPWTELLMALADQPARTALGIALDIQEPPPHLSDSLNELATYFGRLSREGEIETSGLYGGQRRSAPEAFAVDAQTLYLDAARRYRGRVFGLRIAVWSEQPLDDGLLNLVGTTISPPDRSSDATFLDSQLLGAGHRVVRPAPGAELDVFTRNVRTLGLDRWREDVAPRTWEAGGSVDPVSRFQPAAECVRLADPREASAAFRLPIAANGALPGFRVRRPDFAVGIAPDPKPGPSLEIGTQRIGRRDAGPVSVRVDDLTMHAFIVGTTGSGKTSTVIGLLDRLWREHRKPFLVIEPVNTTGDDYRWFVGRPGFETALVLTAGHDAIAPLRINPFEVPCGVRVSEHVSNLLASFDAAFGLWDPLPAIYRKALEQVYVETGWALDDVGVDGAAWPTIEQLVGEMRVVTSALDYTGEARSSIIAASQVRVEQMLTGPLRAVFDCERSTPIDTILDRPCIVELGWLGSANEQETALVIALLLTSIVEHRRAGSAAHELRHLIVVEEAHKLLRRPDPGGGAAPQGDASGAAARLFANVLAEIRKYGEGVLVADQDPAKLVPDAYKNTNLKIVHRLPDESDRQLVGATMRFDPDHVREAAALRQHLAFVHFEGLDRPALVEIDNPRRITDPMPTDDDLVGVVHRLAEEDPAVAGSAMPFATCAGCAHVCRFRARAASLAARRATRRGFGEVFSALPSEPDEEWWRRLRAFQDEVVGRSAERLSAPARSDLDACTFMHLFRQQFTGPAARHDWIDRYRARLAGDRP